MLIHEALMILRAWFCARVFHVPVPPDRRIARRRIKHSVAISHVWWYGGRQ